jgi:uncharacterized Zn-binding protein involved in type VI secretion
VANIRPQKSQGEVILSNPFIVLGDRTDHGGTVVSSSPTTTTHGKQIARLGDQVTCPRCRGSHVIAEGDASMPIDGQPAAYEGCKTTCGAKLIASQFVSTTQPSGGGAAAASSSSSVAGGSDAGAASTSDAVPAGMGSIGGGQAAGYQEEQLDDAGLRFRGRFRVVDTDTGAPIHGLAIRVRSTAGQYVTGTTDADGYTQWLERDAAERLAFDVMENPV